MSALSTAALADLLRKNAQQQGGSPVQKLYARCSEIRKGGIALRRQLKITDEIRYVDRFELSTAAATGPFQLNLRSTGEFETGAQR